MKNHALILALTFLLASQAGAWTAKGQNKEITREEYIVTFAPLAMDQQDKYGIPASIKLAQGMLESRNGNSELSQKSNNHFGIKCKSYWTGDKVYYDDDEAGECFRAYKTVEDSYIDHSLFLSGSKRYEELFKLGDMDYKGWANGLKAAGYATAPHYASSLIKIIDDYQLYLFDRGEYPAYLASVEPLEWLLDGSALMAAGSTAEAGERIIVTVSENGAIDIDNYVVSVNFYAGHGIYSTEGRRYIVAKKGDTFRSVGDALGIKERRLRKFNDRKRHDVMNEGDVVFIDKKPHGRN